MNKCTERLYNGIVRENPTFVQMLGMCPTLAVTTSAINGIGMGLTTTVILVMSNIMISLLRKVIPDRVRIPAFIIVIASFVTIVQFLLEGFIPSLYDSLGIFIPLIVVNCIILGRAESYASRNPVLPSAFDGLGMGLGFTAGLTAIGAFRELLGAGTVFGVQIMPDIYQPVTIFILAPGAFFVLAFLIAAQNKVKINKAEKAGTDYDVCRDADCSHCANAMCGGRFFAFRSAVEGEDADEQVAKGAEAVSEETYPENTGEAAGSRGEVSEPESADVGEKSENEETASEPSQEASGSEAGSEGENKSADVEADEEAYPEDAATEEDSADAEADKSPEDAATKEDSEDAEAGKSPEDAVTEEDSADAEAGKSPEDAVTEEDSEDADADAGKSPEDAVTEKDSEDAGTEELSPDMRQDREALSEETSGSMAAGNKAATTPDSGAQDAQDTETDRKQMSEDGREA